MEPFNHVKTMQLERDPKQDAVVAAAATAPA